MKKRIKNVLKRVRFLYKPYRTFRKQQQLLKKKWDVIHPILKAKFTNKEIIFLVLTPQHGNMGDHAIADAEAKMLRQLGIVFHEVSQDDLFYLEKHKQLGVFYRHPIVITGGGFLGTLWYHDERLVRNIIQANPKSNILLFPNTVFYEDSDYGRAEFEQAKQIYGRYNHLKVFAREKTSYELMQQFCSNVGLAPDMVMSLKEDYVVTQRTGCGLYLRKDKEKTRSDEETERIIEIVRKLFNGRVDENDTVLNVRITFEKRIQYLNSIFKEFRSYELVITDRLHGMIFGAITGTPTIVVNSKSYKVRGCYEWIRNLDYVQFCENIDEIPEIYERMPHGSQKYNNDALLPCYEELRQDLLTIGDKEWPKVRKN